MAEVAARDLRNDTAGLIRRAASGEEIVITVNGHATAQLISLPSRRRRWLSRADLLERLSTASADPGLTADLAWISGEMTDDVESRT